MVAKNSYNNRGGHDSARNNNCGGSYSCSRSPHSDDDETDTLASLSYQMKNIKDSFMHIEDKAREEKER
jgi:hypothetical protein